MGHTYRDSKSLGGKFDYTIQLNTRHELKTGASFRQDDLQERSFTILYDNNQYKKPTVLPANQSPSHIFYDKQALAFSTYLQDKIEYNDVIINAGLRYDYLKPEGDFIVDLLNPEEGRAPAETKQTLSPRLGIAYSWDAKTVIRAGYGIFFTEAFYPGWGGGMSLDGFNLNQSFGSTCAGGVVPAFYIQSGFPQWSACTAPPKAVCGYR